MATHYNTRIVTDNLVLNLDAGNTKSYAGDVASPIGTDYGYFGGGNASASTVDRVDYSNDTATAAAKGPLSEDTSYHAATGNASYGYFGGGYPGEKSKVDRVDYSNDTATAAVKGPLSQARYALGAVGNNSYGYFGGGTNPAVPAKYSLVDRIDYSNDTATAAAKGSLTLARPYAAGTGNSSYGYLGGGFNLPGPNNRTTIVDRIDYSNDTPTAVAKGPLSGGRDVGSATGNASYGYFAGGGTSPLGVLTTVDRLDYSSDTTACATKGPLAVARRQLVATGNTSYGYVGAGRNAQPAGDPVTSVDRIDYSNDTSTAAAKGPVSTARYQLAATSSRANALPTTESATRSTTVPQGTPYGWIVGGSPGNITSFERIDYDNDTATTSTRGALSGAKPYGTGAGNLSYAYIGGGYYGGNLSTVDRLDYSNDNTTAPAKGPLSLARRAPTATGNASYGYFGGGNIPSPATVYTTVDRVDYSNDTATAAAKGPLTIARTTFGATGNLSYGYFCCCSYYPGPENSSVDRVDYSNDTATAAAKGPLTVARGYLGFGVAGNSSYGYISGGFKYPPGTRYSTVERIDYSNDTPTAVAKGPMSAEITGPGQVSSASYGYFAGGAQPAGRSTVDRLDYASDTTACATKGPLSVVKYNCPGVSSKNYGLPATSTIYPWYDTSGKGDDGENTSGGASFSSAGGGSFTFNGTSNYVSSDDKVNLQLGAGNFTLAAWIKPSATPAGTDYGYICGGGPGAVSLVDRVDYSSDTSTASAKGPLATATFWMGSVGSTSYGYLAGGLGAPSAISTVDRLDYSTDTTVTVKGPAGRTCTRLGATGNNSYGYFGGGAPGPANAATDVYRLDYSNDTSAAASKGPLAAATYGITSVSNTSYGYYGGGVGTPGTTYPTTVSRIDFSNDTATATEKGPLTIGRRHAGGAGNASYGYFTGGGSPSGGPVVSSIDRVDYSNDTPTTSPKGPLSAVRRYMGATGNSSYGYFAGGNQYPNPDTSTVDRLDYSSDTSTAVAKGPLTTARDGMGGVSSRANGLPTAIQSDSQGIISYSDTAGEENDTTCQLDVNATGKIKFSGAAGIVTSTSAPTVDTWSHAAITRADNTISLYINGVLENSGITTHTFTDYAKVTIGANRPRSTFYKGDISQVQIYKGKALSSDEVQQNFNALRSRFGV